ncbi:MAG: sigma-54-dependent Fis family transcriptional regulator [Myxococcales bacterium]|nr:sigma-54-dependent Fis family transcriptional regulator [Myxococcales bacterium]
MRSGRILVVDDEVNARRALSSLLHDEGYEVETAADAFKALGKYASFEPHVVITDLKMPGMDGIELLARVKELEDPAAVILITAFSDVSSAVEAMRAGAADYLAKPLSLPHLLISLDRVFERDALRRETHLLRERVRERFAPRNIIGESPQMQRIFEIIDQVAPSRATVLITGESGTGKELVANALHERSPRRNGPFVKLHCAALAETLLESELFGHERGAFTGAIAKKDGRFQIADGGTLFLDEIGEISPAVQIKLLRFLQEHTFERVGGTKTIHVDVRVLVATNKNLVEEVAKGRFREDLFYRLNVVTIEMPALRDRKSDIPELAVAFLERFARENGKVVDGFSQAALDVLRAYDWPGNVRELENAIERAVIFAAGPTFEPQHLPPTVRPSVPSGAPQVPGATLAELTRHAILETLKSCGGSTSHAAAILGISARMIQYKLHQYRAAPRSEVEAVRKLN